MGKELEDDKVVDPKVPDDPKPPTAEEYNALLVRVQGSEAKGKLLDELMEDPEFMALIDNYEDGVKPAAAVGPAAIPATATEKPLAAQATIIESVKELLEPIIKEMDSMKQVYSTDKQAVSQQVIDKTISEMSADKEKYPLFEKVQGKMAELFDAGRCTNLPDAYALASAPFARALGAQESKDKAGGPSEVKLLSAEEKEALTKDDKSTNPFGKKNRRLNLLNAAAEKLGIE